MEVKNFNALLITQYETCGTVGRFEYIENYMYEMEVNINMLSDFNEFLAENNDNSINNMEELEEEINNMDPAEAFRIALASYSQFSWNDDFFSYDGYNNLISYSENQIIKMMKNNTDFLQWYIDKENLIDWEEAEKDIQDANELIRAGY